VAQFAKLIRKVRTNPKDVRFDDACKIAKALGFDRTGGVGSHVAFQRPGNPRNLNFQNRDGKIPPYQARQLLEMIDLYYQETEANIGED